MDHHGVATEKESIVFENVPAMQRVHKCLTSNPAMNREIKDPVILVCLISKILDKFVTDGS